MVHGEYKQTYNWGGHIVRLFNYRSEIENIETWQRIQDKQLHVATDSSYFFTIKGTRGHALGRAFQELPRFLWWALRATYVDGHWAQFLPNCWFNGDISRPFLYILYIEKQIVCGCSYISCFNFHLMCSIWLLSDIQSALNKWFAIVAG